MSSNIPFVIISLLIISIIIVILYYFFVIKCNTEGNDCKTKTDCCDNLECINSICTATPIFSEQATLQIIDSTTCSEWNMETDNNCENGNIPRFGETIGSSHEECCQPMDCNHWNNIDGNNCENGNIPRFGETIGSSHEECCQPNDCNHWDNIDGNDCDEDMIPNPGYTIGNTEEECCRPITCDEWININECPENTHFNTGIDGNSSITCCSPYTCQEWIDSDNQCGDYYIFDQEKSSLPFNRVKHYRNDQPYPERSCCKPNITDCQTWNDFGYSCKEHRKIPLSSYQYSQVQITDENPEDVCCQEGTWHTSSTGNVNCNTICQSVGKTCNPSATRFMYRGGLIDIMDIIDGPCSDNDCPSCENGDVAERQITTPKLCTGDENQDSLCEWGGDSDVEENWISKHAPFYIPGEICYYRDINEQDCESSLDIWSNRVKQICNCI
jgi:hypothetical protein